MGRFLGVTGTPGTGKKTLAPQAARALGLPCIGLNDLLTSTELASASGVDPAAIRRRLTRVTRGRWVVYGHMLPDVLRGSDVDKVVVLRCEPGVLKRRLKERRYSSEKIRINLEAELIGLIHSECLRRFGSERVAQLDSSSPSRQRSAASLAALLRSPASRGSRLDWLPRYYSAVKLRSLLSAASTESAFT